MRSGWSGTDGGHGRELRTLTEDEGEEDEDVDAGLLELSSVGAGAPAPGASCISIGMYSEGASASSGITEMVDLGARSQRCRR